MNPSSRPALALLLCCLATPIAGAAAAAPTAEETRLLGSDRDDAQFQSYMPFNRSLAASGVVRGGSLAQSATSAGVPAAALLEALAALGSAVDLERDVHDGDRFYVRYERTFTAEGHPVGVGRVLWAELRTEAKGTVAIHRFRPLKAATDSFWLSTGRAATPGALRLPLDTITVSSGFGMRADPFDQPLRGQPFRGAVQQWRGRVTASTGALSTGALSAGSLPAGPLGGPPSPFVNPAFAKGRPALDSGSRLGHVNTPTARGLQMGLVAPGAPSSLYSGYGHAPTLAMHEGVDLAADLGTPIHAAGDGVVKGAEQKGGYGNWIEIDHDDLQATAINGKPAKISTVYGHLSAFAAHLAPGMRVKQGDVIGFVGSTGRSTGPHLHFEILQNGHPTNPMISLLLKSDQLKGGDLDRFRKTIARDLAERQGEAGSI